MSQYHLAEINVARFIKPQDDPVNAGFMDALDAVNALADAAPGFVWRLMSESGNATDIEVSSDDPRLAVNMSVWTDVASLAAYAYRNSEHLAIMRRRREWFEHMQFHMALWWIPVGHVPTVEEGMAKIAALAEGGPTADAFTFRHPFDAPDGKPAHPVFDECA